MDDSDDEVLEYTATDNQPDNDVDRDMEAQFDTMMLADKRRKAKLDMRMLNKFRQFIDSDEWNLDYMYTPSDFIKMFGITRHLSRYYLMALVYEKKLYRAKYLNKTWYDKVCDQDMLSLCKEYTWIGVEVTA